MSFILKILYRSSVTYNGEFTDRSRGYWNTPHIRLKRKLKEFTIGCEWNLLLSYIVDESLALEKLSAQSSHLLPVQCELYAEVDLSPKGGPGTQILIVSLFCFRFFRRTVSPYPVIHLNFLQKWSCWRKSKINVSYFIESISTAPRAEGVGLERGTDSKIDSHNTFDDVYNNTTEQHLNMDDVNGFLKYFSRWKRYHWPFFTITYTFSVTQVYTSNVRQLPKTFSTLDIISMTSSKNERNDTNIHCRHSFASYWNLSEIKLLFVVFDLLKKCYFDAVAAGERTFLDVPNVRWYKHQALKIPFSAIFDVSNRRGVTEMLEVPLKSGQRNSFQLKNTSRHVVHFHWGNSKFVQQCDTWWKIQIKWI